MAFSTTCVPTYLVHMSTAIYQSLLFRAKKDVHKKDVNVEIRAVNNYLSAGDEELTQVDKEFMVVVFFG